MLHVLSAAPAGCAFCPALCCSKQQHPRLCAGAERAGTAPLLSSGLGAGRGPCRGWWAQGASARSAWWAALLPPASTAFS